MITYKMILKKLGNAKLKGAQYKVLLKILSKMTDNDDQTAQFTKRALAKELGIKSENNINPDIKHLLEQGYLSVDDTKVNNRTYRPGSFFSSDK